MAVMVVVVGWKVDGAYGGFAGVVEAEEEEFGVLVGQTQLGQHIPDCGRLIVSSVVLQSDVRGDSNVHQSTIHMMGSVLS